MKTTKERATKRWSVSQCSVPWTGYRKCLRSVHGAHFRREPSRWRIRARKVREMFIAALGCNLAWGLVDAVMYVVRAVTIAAGRLRSHAPCERPPDAETGARSSSVAVAGGGGSRLPDGGRGNPRANRRSAFRAGATDLRRNDLLAALAIFLFVVVVTFPVVLPFALIQDVGMATNESAPSPW